jgi:glycosyltransferase involved in cell wall biosynthesis
MKISIAMATYNGSHYLKAQLQSFIEQTRQPDEVIITDDCSTDHTEMIVRDFAKTAPFEVKFFRNQKNLGYCGNFNAALMKTTGDLVFLSDQDDVWFPKKIEHMLGLVDQHPEALVLMNDATLTDSELKEVGLTKIGQTRSADPTMNSFVMGCCCAVRRELLDFALPIPTGLKSHDNWIVFLADGINAKIVDETPLQYYRRHESNESQFIANRTTRVTRRQAFMHTVRKLFHKDSATTARIQLEQWQIFADGVNAVLATAPERYHNSLRTLESRRRQKIDTTRQRMTVRSKPLLFRSVAAYRLLIRGGYRSTSGVKALLRDMLGL